MKGLGRRQKEVLKLMQSNPNYSWWSTSAGWVWGTNSETDRVMRRFAELGIVDVECERESSGCGRYRLKPEFAATSDR